MCRWMVAVAAGLIIVLLVSLGWAAAGGLDLQGLGSPATGVHEGSGCDVGEVYPHPVSTSAGSDVWTYWRLETSAYDAATCAGMEIRIKVAWDGADAGTEPDGYYYMRVPVSADLNKPHVVGRTILGVFGDAVDDICDPDNCYEKDPQGQYIVRYVYSSFTYDPADIIDTSPTVADHQLGEARWVVVPDDTALADF